MISAGEVGAVFRIGDEASAQLRRMAEQFDALQAAVDRTQAAFKALAIPPGVNRSLGRMEERMSKVADAAKLTSDAIASSFANVDKSIATSAGALADLAKELKAVGVESRAIGGAPNLRYGGVGRGRGSSGAHVSAPRVGAGGFHLGGMSLPAQVAAGAIAYGVYEEAEIEDIVARAMVTGQLHVDDGMRQTDAFKSMRDIIQRSSAKTGFSPKDVGEALLTTERQFGGLAFNDRLRLEETLIPFAASEARMKESSLPESFEALVGLAHMSGTYDPKQLPELMRQFQYASMITPVPIDQFSKAIGYSLPMLHAGLDMDPASAMFLTAMTQTAGITNTKSGTWLRSFFENAEPRVGDHLSKQAITHNEALEKMGLLDSHDNLTWQVKGANGKVDWDASIVKMSELINKFTSVTDPATRLSTLRTAFGERGGGEAALMNLDQFIGQFPVLEARMRAFQGGDNVLGSLTDASPVQQARNAWADTQNVLIDIGQSVLPPLTGALGQFDKMLKSLHTTLGDPAANGVVGAGVLGGVVAYLTRGSWGPALGRLVSGGGALAGLGLAESYLYGQMSGSWFDRTFPGFSRLWKGLAASTTGNLGDSGSPMDPWAWERGRRSAADFRRDPEAAHAAVMSSGAFARATSTPIVDTKVDVKVTLDGRAIAAAVEKHIVNSNTFVNSASGFDGRMHFRSPDGGPF